MFKYNYFGTEVYHNVCQRNVFNKIELKFIQHVRFYHLFLIDNFICNMRYTSDNMLLIEMCLSRSQTIHEL